MVKRYLVTFQLEVDEGSGNASAAMVGQEVQQIATPEGNRVLAPLEMYEVANQVMFLILKHQRGLAEGQSANVRVVPAKMGARPN